MTTNHAATARDFDIVVFGATGFTGRLVADYLARRAPAHVRWALAGRNAEKLAAVKAALPAGSAALPELAVADAADAASLTAVAARTRVVCTTVGPYAKHGLPLAIACADAGTDYCDITGEVQYVRAVIDQCDARAKETGARVVPCCGFDSIPSDLGVYLAHRYLRQHHDRHLARAAFYCGPMRGGFSGGTVASILNLLEQAAGDAALRRLLSDPYSLNDQRPAGPVPTPDGPRGPHYEARLGAWTAPFLMSAINTRVVRRTNELLGFAYGRDFLYTEATNVGRGVAGAATAAALTAGLGALVGVGATPFGRRLLARKFGVSGTGPSERARAEGFFKIRVLAESDASKGTPPVAVEARVAGRSDPGYGETSKMLAESALCLALDRDSLPPRAGVLTTAAAMADPLIERLRAAGMTFDVDDRPTHDGT